MENVVVNKSGFLWSYDIKAVSECFLFTKKIKTEDEQKFEKARGVALYGPVTQNQSGFIENIFPMEL